MEIIAKMSGSAATLLWIIAAVLVIAGIVTIVRGAVLFGIVLIVVGLTYFPVLALGPIVEHLSV